MIKVEPPACAGWDVVQQVKVRQKKKRLRKRRLMSVLSANTIVVTYADWDLFTLPEIRPSHKD